MKRNGSRAFDALIGLLAVLVVVAALLGLTEAI